MGFIYKGTAEGVDFSNLLLFLVPEGCICCECGAVVLK